MSIATMRLTIKRVCPPTGEEIEIEIPQDETADQNELIEAALPLSWKLKRLPPSWESQGMTLEDALRLSRPKNFFADDNPTKPETRENASRS